MKKFRIIFLSIIFVILGISLTLLLIFKDSDFFYNKKIINKSDVEAILAKKNDELKNISQQILKIEHETPKDLSAFFFEQNPNLYKNNGIGIFYYQNNKLKYWTTNNFPVPTTATQHFFDKKIINLNNGWFLCSVLDLSEEVFIVALFQIKKEYSYDNNNLNYNYFSELKIPENTEITIDHREKSVVIEVPESEMSLYLFTKKSSLQDIKNVKYFIAVVFILLHIFGLLFYGFYLLLLKSKKNNLFLFLAFFVILLLIRWILLHFNDLFLLSKTNIFDASVFAQSFWLPSLTDLIINVLVFFVSSLLFKRFFIFTFNTKHTKVAKTSVSFILSVLMLFSAEIMLQLFYGLVINSSISFEFSNLFSINLYSIIGTILLILILISFALIFYRLFITFKQYCSLILIFTLLTLGFISACFIYNNKNLDISTTILFNILFFIYFGFLTIITLKNWKSYTSQIVFIIIIALIVSLNFSHLTPFKEFEKTKIFFMKISEEGDVIAEYFIQNIEQELSKDEKLGKIINSNDYNKIGDYVNEKIKSKAYFNKYDSFITICNNNDTLTFQDSQATESCNIYFENLYHENGIKILNSNFYLIKNSNGRINYISEIRNIKSDTTDTKIYVEFFSKIFSEGLGYPELLLDKKLVVERDFKSYNYVKYINNILVLNNNPFQYEYSSTLDYCEDTATYCSLIKNGYIHYHYRPDKDRLLILSKPYSQILNDIISFAYIFIVIFLGFNVYRMFVIWERNKLKNFFNLRVKIYTASISTMLLSLLFLGIIALYFINQAYRQKQKALAQDKLNSVVLQLNNYFSEEASFSLTNLAQLNQYLIDLSNSYFSDINIYDTNGLLAVSSRNEFYDKGLKGRYMDPIAFDRLIVKNNTSVFLQDKIDKINFLSAYVPLKDANNHIIAYINLPYFSRQSEYRTEISNFLTAFVNTFFILMIISIIISLFIARQITSPLNLVQRKFKDIKLTSHNEKIFYSKKDEIGALIDEYNQKIDELQISAEKLAQSERENAWREMAKQIAHEIKNPLTPMKLNIQYLVQNYKQNDERWEEIFKRMSIVIIEQIDTLSNIASEFSNFAKMPIPQRTKCDLKQIIVNSVSVFNIDLEKIHFVLIFDKSKDYFIFADKEQMLRVFNNIIKNATQSIPSENKGIITINIIESHKNYFIEITDNGCGIPEQMIDKMFKPNFTTKSSGMGLGLSMVKAMLLSNDASINFKTQKNTGTTFTIKIAKYIQNS